MNAVSVWEGDPASYPGWSDLLYNVSMSLMSTRSADLQYDTNWMLRMGSWTTVFCKDNLSAASQLTPAEMKKFSVIPKILHKKSLPWWHSVIISTKVFWSQIELSFSFIIVLPWYKNSSLHLPPHLPSPPFCLSPPSSRLCYWSVSRSATVTSVLSPPTSKRMKSTTTSMTRLLHTLTTTCDSTSTCIEEKNVVSLHA